MVAVGPCWKYIPPDVVPALEGSVADSIFVLVDRKAALEKELATWVAAGKWADMITIIGQTMAKGPGDNQAQA